MSDWKNVQYKNGKLRTNNGGGGGASALSDLTDVDLNNLQDGQIIKWDATNEKFVNANESGGGSSKIDKLWDSESYTSGAVIDTVYNLAHNLSDYDIGYIIFAVVSDRTGSSALHTTSYQSFIISDLFSESAENRHVLIAGYSTRFRSILFTDSTFKVENIGSDFVIFKIYGVKL